MRRVDRAELARAIEKWGVFRWGRRRVQLQIWCTDLDLARRLCRQYRRKFYACRITRPYLRQEGHETVYPVTFSQRGTAAVMIWARGKFACDRHRHLADAIWEASCAAKRVRSTFGRIRNDRTDRYLHAKRRLIEFHDAFERVRAAHHRFWAECPVSLYGEWERVKDAERATA